MAQAITTFHTLEGRTREASLLGLPLELFELILCSLLPADLANIRLCCRVTEVKSRMYIAKRHMRQRDVVFSSHGLQFLECLTRNRTFAATLMHIDLIPPLRQLTKLQADLKSLTTDSTGLLSRIPRPSSSFVNIDKRPDESLVSKLTTILRGLTGLRRVRLVSKRVKGLRTEDERVLIMNDMRATFNFTVLATVSAVAASEARISEVTVTVGPLAPWTDIAADRVSLPQNITYGPVTAFKYLKKLDTTVSLGTDHEATEGFLAEFLQVTPFLEHLTLWFLGRESGQGIFHCIAAGVKLCHLKVLRLQMLKTNETDMIKFLTVHKNTLQNLGLHNINLKEGSWLPIFDLMRSGMHKLDLIRLHHLFKPGGREHISSLETERTRLADDIQVLVATA